ncbi:MAG: hypothetical protein ACXWUG_11240 [Polyangiales bacterium]
MASRLFHAIVLVGASIGCSSSTTEPAPTSDAKADGSGSDAVSSEVSSEVGDDSAFPTIGFDAGSDTFPGIMPAPTDAFAPIK